MSVKLSVSLPLTIAQECCVLLDDMTRAFAPAVMREILSRGSRIQVPVDIPARERVSAGLADFPRGLELSDQQLTELALLLADTASMLDLFATIIDVAVRDRSALYPRRSQLEKKQRQVCSKSELRSISQRVKELSSTLVAPSKEDSIGAIMKMSDRIRFFIYHFIGYDPVTRLPFGFDDSLSRS
jgi:hypothetical protein